MSDKNASKRATAWNRNNKERRSIIARRYDWKRHGASEPTRSEPKGCEICGEAPSGRDRHLQNDHEHLTGSFRGWICRRCNRVLGMLKDSSDLCIALARYLRRSQL